MSTSRPSGSESALCENTLGQAKTESTRPVHPVARHGSGTTGSSGGRQRFPVESGGCHDRVGDDPCLFPVEDGAAEQEPMPHLTDNRVDQEVVVPPDLAAGAGPGAGAGPELTSRAGLAAVT
ncbi:hypothetical protein ABIA33_005647 [Streptacidiphilus sp. MAP12-16]